MTTPEPATPAAPDPGRFRRLLSRFVKPYRVPIALALVAMIANSALTLPLPLLQGWVLDRLVPLAGPAPGGAPDRGAAAAVIWTGLGLTLFCLAGRMALAWLAGCTMTRVSYEVIRELTDELHRKLQRLPMGYFDARQTGRIMARLTGDVGSLHVFVSGGTLQLVSDLVLAAGIAAVLLALRWELALVSFAVLPLYVLNHRFFAAKIRRISDAVRAQVAALYGLLSERISAVRVVRSFAKEEEELAALDERIDTHRARSWENMQASALQGALATLLSGLGTVAVLTWGVVLAGRGALTPGELLAFYGLLGLLYNPIVRLTQFHLTFAGTRVAIDRMMEVLEEPEVLCDRPGARPVRRPRGAVTFRGVTFRYRPGGTPALSGVSFHVEPGTKVGILGASGAGKSTLLALIPRMYDVEDGHGAVLLDGEDVRDLKTRDLRREVALVPQQAVLFEGTIRSNLTYAAPDASEEAIRRALEAADLAGLIDSLPQGLETPVGERGVSLSGGQRQRLALARTLLAEPSVLLLDDCTSALDAETEARVREALEALLPGRTCLIVSHKVQSVRRADRILVLDAGRVVEEGTHAELLARGGIYAETFHRQCGRARKGALVGAGA